MIKFLLLTTMVVLAATTSTGLESIFAEVPKSTLGSAIQSLIQMHTSDADFRLKELSDLLYDLRASLDKQQSEADKHIENNRNQCEGSLNLYEKNLNEAKGKLEDSKQEKKELQEEQSAKQNQLNNEKTNHESTGNDLEQAQKDLSEEGSKFSEYKASFEEAIMACEEAIRLMTQLANGGGPQSFIQKGRNSGIMFVQLSQKFSDVKGLLENHVKKGGPAAFVQPIIDVLSELSSQAHVDVGKVEQIIQLIQTLLTRLREGLVERTQANVKTVNDLNDLISSLQSALGRSGNQITILETRLGEIATRLTELTGVVGDLEDIVVATQKLIVDTKNDCDEEEEIYSKETAQRTANLQLLDKLIQHFETQVVTTTSNIREGQVE